jgi:hypothetical protein
MVKAKLAALAELKSDGEIRWKGKAEVKQVASISAESEVLQETSLPRRLKKVVGSSGVVTVEESQGMELSDDIVEGLQIDRAMYRRI